MKVLRILALVIISMLLINACDDDKSVKSKNSDPADVLFINEFLASNDDTNADENGEYDDWIEIYNAGDEDIDLGGYYISDHLDEPLTYQIPKTDAAATTVKAGGYLILWCDKETEQGAAHVEIKLSGDGEDIVLTLDDGLTEIDSYTFGPATTGVSTGRATDGGDEWVSFDTPTPGASNE
eukprot:Anaeramoba_ignava/a506140_4.p1 GENE.a506140_4~~a506140_4.p1  ORF type:complete len:181 (-),score=27.82 a506140_4:58-600(-)